MLKFFLGGHDLEMIAIRDLIERTRPGRCHDRGLAWGARASAYRDEIRAALASGETPVLVELASDLDIPSVRATDVVGVARIQGDGRTVVVVDHHGPAAGADRPTALHQVFDLLRLPPGAWSRRLELVAANDRGHLPALLESGATPDEMIRIRAEDRAAQGVRLEDELAATEAVVRREIRADGELTVLRLPTDRTSAAADRMESILGGPGYRNLLCVGPKEVGFFGAGRLIAALDRRFPGGWSGGALPERGFWGHRIPPGEPEVVEGIERELAEMAALPNSH